MAELLSSIIASIVCLFKGHAFVAWDNYNHCARCGKLEVREVDIEL